MSVRARAGRLRHRVTVEEPVETQDSFGEPDVSWQEVDTRWASVEPLTGQERFRAQQVHAEVSHSVRMRYMDGVTPKMRVQHDGRVLDIEAVMDIEERGRMLELLCTEVAGG